MFAISSGISSMDTDWSSSDISSNEAAVGVMHRLEHSQKEIVLQSIHDPVFILQSTIECMVQ